MEFEWDKTKARLNLQKHDVDFADSISVIEDPLALTIRDDDPDEDRFVTIGMDILGRILVVVFTWRADSIRLISARKATKQERRIYEEQIK